MQAPSPGFVSRRSYHLDTRQIQSSNFEKLIVQAFDFRELNIRAFDLEEPAHYEDLPKSSSQSELVEDSPRKLHGIKWAIMYTSMVSSTFLFALDNTVVADVQPAILHTFGRLSDLAWVGVGFALGAVSILPWGKAYGIFNMKWIYIATLLLFEIGSTLCGAANNMDMFIVGRVIAGIGGSGMYSGTLTYISVTTTKNERPIYMAGVSVTWGLGTVLGPVVGGAFTESSATWRWAFYINLVIFALFAPAFFYLLPNVDLKAGTPLLQKLKMMDWLAMTVLFAGTACFSMALNFGGTRYAWTSSSEIVLLVMTVVLFIAMVLVTVYHPLVSVENRLYPAHFIRRFELVNIQLQLCLANGVMLTTAYYIPLYFQFAKGDSALQAAVRLLPFIMMMILFAILNGALMPKLGYYMVWYTVGSALALVGVALMYTIGPDSSASRVYGYTALVGIGAGCYLAASFAVGPALVAPEEVNNVVGFLSVAQVLGIVTFLTVAGSIYQNLTPGRIAPILAGSAGANVAEVMAGASNPAFQALPESIRTAVVAQITSVMSNVWLLLVAALGLSFLLSLFLGREKLYMEAAAGGG